jgi:hypothetical protein
MDSQISSGDHMQLLSRDIHYPAETFQKAIHYLLANSKGRWIAACNKPNLHVAFHYLFTILRNVSFTFLKMSKNN